jgi:hypothetical protein
LAWLVDSWRTDERIYFLDLVGLLTISSMGELTVLDVLRGDSRQVGSSYRGESYTRSVIRYFATPDLSLATHVVIKD